MPRYLVCLLALGLPGVWVLSWKWLEWAEVETVSRRLVRPVFFLVLLILGTHVCALALHSFLKGLGAALVLFNAGALICRRGSREKKSRDLSPLPWQGWASATVATAALLYPTLTWTFFDQMKWIGHLSLPSSFVFGAYPPRLLTFPEYELRYHYGFDILAAIASTLTGLPMNFSVDALTLGLFFVCFFILWRWGQLRVGRAAAVVIPLLVLFGGALPLGHATWPAGTVSGKWANAFVYGTEIGGVKLNGPMLGWFFQRPWAIGLPILGLILILLEESDLLARANRWAVGALAVSLSALALCQVVLFCLVSGALVCMGIACLFRRRMQTARPIFMALIGALAAMGMRGFFIRAYQKEADPLWHPGGFFAHFGMSAAVWTALTFGFLIPAAILALKRGNRTAGFLGICALEAAAIFFLFRYPLSYDMAKFAAAAHVFLALLAAPVLAGWVKSLSIWPRIAGYGCLVCVCSWGVGALAVFWMAPQRIPFPRGLPYFSKSPMFSPSDWDAVAWLRGKVDPREILYREKTQSLLYAIKGGLSVPWTDDSVAKSYGVPAEKIEERSRLEKGLPSDFTFVASKGIAWFVVPADPADHDRQVVQAWRKHADVDLEKQIGELEIYHARGNRKVYAD